MQFNNSIKGECKMAKLPFERDGLILRGRKVTFFNTTGYKKGGKWCVDIETTDSFEEDVIQQDSAAEEIDAGLYWDRVNNKNPKIVRVSPLIGMRLYLEGAIKLKDIYGAKTDEKTIRFQDITIIKATNTTVEIIVDSSIDCDFKTFEEEHVELGNY